MRKIEIKPIVKFPIDYKVAEEEDFIRKVRLHNISMLEEMEDSFLGERVDMSFLNKQQGKPKTV